MTDDRYNKKYFLHNTVKASCSINVSNEHHHVVEPEMEYFENGIDDRAVHSISEAICRHATEQDRCVSTRLYGEYCLFVRTDFTYKTGYNVVLYDNNNEIVTEVSATKSMVGLQSVIQELIVFAYYHYKGLNNGNNQEQ